VASLECGQWYSSPCVCDSDVKYCDDGENGASDDIIDQHPFWKDFVGYFKYEVTDLGTPLNDPTARTNPRFLDAHGYLNNTIVGTRLYRHQYSIAKPNPDVNCTAPDLSGGQPDCFSECGFGCAFMVEGYATSTPERDGTVLTTLELQPSLNIPITMPGLDVDNTMEGDFKQVPIDETTLFGSAVSGVFKITNTFTFTNPDKSQASAIEDVYMNVGGQSYLVSQTRSTYTRMPDEESFMAAIKASYEEDKIRDSKKPSVPMTSSCSQTDQESCPSEEDFCEIDPHCVAEAKYQEPDATLKAGPIAGIVVACFVVLIGVLYYFHLQQMKAQAARNQAVFARRIAETIKLEGPDRELTPEALAEEFKKIDNGCVDGNIDKKELWEFLNSGKVNKMNEKDFNALFAALDTDGDGTVSFMEFSAYMGKAYGDFEKMKDSASVRDMRGGTKSDKFYSGVSTRILSVPEPAKEVEKMEEIAEENV